MAEDDLEAREKAGDLVIPPEESNLYLEREAIRATRERA
jgi:hypothetical protein